jgi:predicted transposase YbfD/YdcC
MARSHRVALVEHFAGLPDPRVPRTRRHELTDILVIAICAVICACESWEDIAAYGRAKAVWFRAFLSLPHGIPSHDTFRRVFNRLNPEAFQRCFRSWIAALSQAKGLKQIAIDGKTLRRSFDRAAGKAALHLVSAWATENHLTLGQVAVDAKSNEITAIPKLLDLLDLTGAVVTIDAMGCQKEIAQQIRRGGGHYVLALKENQPLLYADVARCWAQALEDGRPGQDYERHETLDKGHGRTETRTCYLRRAPQGLHQAEQWPDLYALCLVCSERTVGHQTQTEVRYYLGSWPGTAAQYLGVIRSHWGIENSLHWVLDVTFHEDANRTRKEHGPENVALLRRLAVSLLKQDQTRSGSIHNKRLQAGWDDDYLLRVLRSSSGE